MTIFDKAREKCKIISLIVKFQNSVFYPALFAIICAISGVSGKEVYLPCFLILTIFAVFAGIFSPDLKVFIVPAFMLYYALGTDIPADAVEHWPYAPKFDTASLPYLIAMALLIFIVLVYRLFTSGFIKETLAKRGIFFWGIISIDAALILGGVFSSEFSTTSVLFGAMLAFVLTLSYLLFIVIFSHSQNGISYACKALVAMGFAVLLEVIVIAYRLNLDGILFMDGFRVSRHFLSLSWGLATIIGGALVPAIAASIYLARTGKFPILSWLCAAILFCGAIFINTRSAIIMGAAILILGTILCCTGGKNKKINRIFILSVLAALAAAAVIFVVKFPDTYHSVIEAILDMLRFDVDIDSEKEISNFLSGRPAIWKHGLEDFLSSPIFGTGFLYGYFTPESASSNLFTNMYHNVFVQFLASMGIVGILVFLFHAKHIVEVLLRRFCAEKLLLLMIPCSILGMSLADNFFFYPNFIIIYTAFLAAAEHYLEKAREARLTNLKVPRKNGKPRVVFTYVEAGKGHIIPTRNVCEVFRKKYSDRVDVVESNFFKETDSDALEKTERFFSRTVKQQNRSPIMSVLCKIGNIISGDSLALYYMLKLTISGRKANPLAVKHAEELDADVIYTAHWAIPFYINQFKGPRPYTVCFCPDIYSNGAFNVDCNRFLIPSDVGYRQICRHRMYAGGNVTQVPFPMRPDAINYKSGANKELYRTKLGIPKDEFTVVLCDGGYGMARLEGTAKALMKSRHPMTVIAMCGTNKKLFLRLSELAKKTPEHIRLIAVDFTDKPLEYFICADVFVGKSGANSIAEPAALGIPIVITKCATYIERGIKDYYVRKIKGAMYIPSARGAALQIEMLAKNPELLKKYSDNLKNSERLHYDAEASADIVFESLKEIYPNL